MSTEESKPRGGLDRDPLTHTICGDLKRGIQLTFENRLFSSALILLFSSIDVLATLDRMEGQEEGTPEDFIRWCERYLMPDLPSGIPGEELYSTRCAVLHAVGVESRRTRAGRVRRVSFIIGGGPSIAYNPGIDPTLVLINLDRLIAAFFAAINRYVVSAFANTERRRVIEERLGEMLMAIPYEPNA